MSEPRTALLIAYANIQSDSRVRRQIDWLTETGWSVDTLGLGEHPTEQVRTHFALVDQAPWVQTRAGSAIIFGLLSHRRQFKLVQEDRIPKEAASRISSGEYDLVFFNDYELTPWTGNKYVFTAEALRGRIHLDLHEFRDARRKRDSAWRILTDGYYRWARRFIGDPVFNTRSTVATKLADFYSQEFGFEPPTVVRNVPLYTDQAPTPVDPGNIKLLYHGMASWSRGLRELIDAAELLDGRFSVTLMLTENQNMIQKLSELARKSSRVEIVPPVPMRDVSTAINPYDLEIMFFPPVSRNLKFALPNKLFEAVQARLGLVIGESPMMQEVIRQHDNGRVVQGWTAQDLAASLNALTTDQIVEFKNASHQAAPVLCAETERGAFLNSIGIEA